MSEPSDKIPKLPTFDGKAANFQAWWWRFRAYAAVHKFLEALSEDGDKHMPARDDTALDPTKSLDKLKILAKK